MPYMTLAFLRLSGGRGEGNGLKWVQRHISFSNKYPKQISPLILPHSVQNTAEFATFCFLFRLSLILVLSIKNKTK